MKIETWEEGVHAVYDWSKSRGILEQSSVQKQLEKAKQEIEEFYKAETEDEQKDEYGDVLVCLINVLIMSGNGLTEIAEAAKRHEYEESLLYSMKFSEKLDNELDAFCILSLNSIALECLSISVTKIYSRRGMMVDGFYVKWNDLTDEQKVIAKERGI